MIVCNQNCILRRKYVILCKEFCCGQQFDDSAKIKRGNKCTHEPTLQ
jgi:hypothetical protein